MGGYIVGGVPAHGAEFQDVKIGLALAHAALAEKHRSRGIELDPQCHQCHGDGQHKDGSQRKDNIQQTLDIVAIHRGHSSFTVGLRSLRACASSALESSAVLPLAATTVWSAQTRRLG